jgi:hypothetical protein
MAPRKFSARTCLKVPLELECWFFFVELDYDQELPRTIESGMW